MSRIDDLIAELCPKGVAYRELGEIAETIAGLTGKTKADFTGGNARYVSYKNVFANLAVDQKSPDYVRVGPHEKQNMLMEGDVVITGSSESLDEVGMSSVVEARPNEALYLNSFCFCVRFRDSLAMIPGFSKYLFRSELVRSQIRRTANGVTRINISKSRFLKVRIPVPPLEVQREIIRILDTFTKLEAELEAELEARRQQYEHYQYVLTAPFDLNHELKVEWSSVRLGEICKIEKGKTAIQKSTPGDYPLVTTSIERQSSDDYQFAEEAVCIPLISSKGHGVASISRLYYQSGEFALGSILAAVIPTDPNQLSAEYLYHFLSARKNSLLVPLMRGGANVSLTIDSLKKVSIQFPSLDEQLDRISALRGFDALVSDPEVGLPAELDGRRKQYEYYRDKLLTFEEASA